MQYLLMIYDEDKVWEKMPEAERNAVYAEYGAYTTALQESGALLGANQLQPTQTAKTVRADNGQKVVTDGPFAETKEQLGGYYLVDAESLDAAVAWAHKLEPVADGSIEVRPVMEHIAVDSPPARSS